MPGQIQFCVPTRDGNKTRFVKPDDKGKSLDLQRSCTMLISQKDIASLKRNTIHRPGGPDT
ncbi:hypothetical protein AA0228_1329 [Gluconobacter frateurii NRIC 0228]|uniref:Uncharacterized protein n=1 Tax=Gluconobacter frateurii NRIC 0228 TaxID=1307946 RepID=A0ABQ0QAT2_9PROT|nr:hypothetical protein AA0228_1329 [Gluconobacter frateurii NRIC 0228]